MEWWGVYLNGDRQQRYLSYISRQAAEYYAQSLNSRNFRKSGVRFIAMEQKLLKDEYYDGLRIY